MQRKCLCFVKKMSFFFSLSKIIVTMINNNVTLDVSKNNQKTFFIRYHFRLLFCLNLFLYFFCFVKLALGLNNVSIKSDVQTNRKRKRPLCVSTKNHPKNKLFSAILYTSFFFSPILFMCYLDF